MRVSNEIEFSSTESFWDLGDVDEEGQTTDGVHSKHSGQEQLKNTKQVI